MNISTVSSASSSGLSTGQTPRVDAREFLTLLTTQLRNQDPLQPTSNTEFLGQLAQLTQLEETQSQTATLRSIAAATSAGASLQGLAQASNLIGKDISFVDVGGGESQGIVEKVAFEDGNILLEVGDRSVPLGAVLSVSAGK